MKLIEIIIMFLYFLPFLYCIYLSIQKQDNLYEKQLVWYYIIVFIPAFLTFYFVKNKIKIEIK